MNVIAQTVWHLSRRAREKRAEIFRRCFTFDKTTKILDVGSENGTNINLVLGDLPILRENVFVADINAEAVTEAHKNFGFQPILLDETGKLPFADNFFDIVFCSSVIEHTTIPKEKLWQTKSGKEFREKSWQRQKEFAAELQRVGKQYFVQTPNKFFIIESHTWLPFLGYLPRRILLPALRLTNKFWVKSAEPDFNLLGASEMRELFPDAEIYREKKFGLTKSVTAIKPSNF